MFGESAVVIVMVVRTHLNTGSDGKGESRQSVSEHHFSVDQLVVFRLLGVVDLCLRVIILVEVDGWFAFGQ